MKPSKGLKHNSPKIYHAKDPVYIFEHDTWPQILLN